MKKNKKTNFSIKAAFKLGWEISKKNWKLAFAVSLINLAVEVFFIFFIFYSRDDKGIAFSFRLIRYLVGTWLGAGLFLMAVKLVTTKKKVTIDVLFPSAHKVLKYFAGCVMLGTVFMVGMIFLVIPGIFLVCKYYFVPCLMVDKNLRMRKAFEVSAQMTKGIKLKLFLFSLSSLGILILGLLACFVGVFWSVFIVNVANASVYRSVLLRTNRSLALKVA